MPIIERHLLTLEFDKVRALLRRHASFSASEHLAEVLVPSIDSVEILRRQNATEEARRLLEVRPNSGVRGARDVRPSAQRAAIGGLLNASELLEVAGTIGAGRSMRNLLGRQEIRAPTLASQARRIPNLDELEAAIRAAIDDEGHVVDGASERLRRIRADIRSSYDRLMHRLQDLIAGSQLRDALQDPVITVRGGRYVVPVKADFRGRVPGIVHDQSASGATLFVEPLAVVELTNTWKQKGVEEEREIERILAELSGLARASHYGIEDTVDALARIDLSFAMAHLALGMHATRPLFHSFDDSTAREPLLKLILARHPLLAGEIVPIDIELGGAFDVLLITGPNTGGKTVALKTAGLLALMAQAGLQIPAAEGSATTVFSGVFADIGDEQSIEQSLSTFSSHITRIIETLKSADSHSLVLLDEVGAGTDPLEGAALSRAILEHLVQSHILTIATTHFSELKVFAYDAARVQNASVEFNPETLLPTYRLIIGLPGRSNALTIAERLGLPPSIVSAARGFISPDERRVDELLAEIHQELEHARSERADESRRRLEAERLERQVKARLATAEEERSTILAGAEEEVAVLMSELRREADAIRRELRGLGEERRRSSALEERIAALRARAGTVLNRRPEATVAHGPFALGESVLVASLGATGIVRSLSSDGEVAEVEVGGMRARVRIGDLSPSGAAPTPRERARAAGYLNSADSPRGTADRSTWSGVQSQIDLRGLTTEEGRQRVDQYLNDAYMEGVSPVRIIHGKGTGALRQVVHELLADHPLVRSHATADRSEGGEGATVVHIAT